MEKLSIGSVSRLTGLTEFTLRAWERRHSIVSPSRTPSGRRIYSQKDVEKLKLLKMLTQSGLAIGDVAALKKTELLRLLKRGGHKETQVYSKASDQIAHLCDAAKVLDLYGFQSALKTAQLQYDTRTLLLQIVAPFLRWVGEEVEQGRLKIYQEHASTALLRNFLTGIFYSAEMHSKLTSQGGPVIFATPEGDLHEFGILIAAILTVLRGVPVIYLGPNTPMQALAEASVFVQCPLIVIGIAAPIEELSQNSIKNYLNEVLRRTSKSTEIWTAGPATEGLEIHSPSDRFQNLAGFGEFESLLTKFVNRE